MKRKISWRASSLPRHERLPATFDKNIKHEVKYVWENGTPVACMSLHVIETGLLRVEIRTTLRDWRCYVGQVGQHSGLDSSSCAIWKPAWPGSKLGCLEARLVCYGMVRFLGELHYYITTLLHSFYVIANVCHLSVTLVHPAQKVELCGNILHHNSLNKKPSYCWDSQPSVAIFRT